MKYFGSTYMYFLRCINFIFYLKSYIFFNLNKSDLIIYLVISLIKIKIINLKQ